MEKEYLEDLDELMIDEGILEERRIANFKCKPTYNFQSIEFEIACDIHDLSEMTALYDKCLAILMTIAPEQNAKVAPAKPVELASPKQKEIMDRFHIPYDAGITKDEANILINESMRKKNV